MNINIDININIDTIISIDKNINMNIGIIVINVISIIMTRPYFDVNPKLFTNGTWQCRSNLEVLDARGRPEGP